jgi:hypothetical protein
LREQGQSIRDITRRLGVSKASASRWCQDIELTTAQKLQLSLRKEGAVRRGQLLGALTQKKKRQAVVDRYLREGRERFKTVRDVEYFTAGLALYLAEGAKTMRQVHFVSADPRVVLFMMRWLEKFFAKETKDFAVSVLINESHRYRQDAVVRFWSRYLGIPRNQFRKTIFVKVKQQKAYSNHEKYYGTMRFTVLKSTALFYIISGLMEGFLQHLPKPA